MNEITPSFHITYRFERHDFVAMTRALAHKPWTWRLAAVALWLVLVLIFLLLLRSSSLEILQRGLRMVVLDYLPLWVIGGIALLFNNRIMGLTAAAIFKNNAYANQEIELFIRKSGIESRAQGIRAEFTWAAVKRIIETSTHLFLAISKREALIIPRRAFASDDAYQDARGFIVSHAGPEVPVARQ
jgi:hypothetical protein